LRRRLGDKRRSDERLGGKKEFEHERNDKGKN